MGKKLREIQNSIIEKNTKMQEYINGESIDETVLKGMIQEIEDLESKSELIKKAENLTGLNAAKNVPMFSENDEKDGFNVISKMFKRQNLTVEEKALITGTNAANGENNIIPQDVKTEINEMRKTYISAKDIVNVESTNSLKGSVIYESGTPAGLVSFDDGSEITSENNISFRNISFAIKSFGKLIPVSKILLGAEKGGLKGYLNRWFVKNAIITENSEIFGKLKSGYNSGTAKALEGWGALKKSINIDLDPSCLINGVIITNQSGFNCLDEEKDENGRPILQSNPANPTAKIFQGLPIKVFSNSQLANIDDTHFPVFFGDTKAGCTFVEYEDLTFDVSEHYLFNKNQDCMRVTEGFDVMSTDTTAYIYGSFSATPKAVADDTTSNDTSSQNTHSGS